MQLGKPRRSTVWPGQRTGGRWCPLKVGKPGAGQESACALSEVGSLGGTGSKLFLFSTGITVSWFFFKAHSGLNF